MYKIGRQKWINFYNPHGLSIYQWFHAFQFVKDNDIFQLLDIVKLLLKLVECPIVCHDVVAFQWSELD